MLLFFRKQFFRNITFDADIISTIAIISNIKSKRKLLNEKHYNIKELYKNSIIDSISLILLIVVILRLYSFNVFFNLSIFWYDSLCSNHCKIANLSSENDFIDLSIITRNAFDNVRLHSIINDNFIQLSDNIQSWKFFYLYYWYYNNN